MITALDTNVLVDLGVEDAERARKAAQAIEECGSAGPLVVCDITLAEFASGFPEDGDPAACVRELGILYDPIRKVTAVEAGRIHARYEKRAGRPVRRPFPDFLVGAHALIQADRLLTRDRGFYRNYFEGLRLVEPA